MDELERALDRGAFGAIVVHLLGLDYCKDRGLPTDGAMLVLRRLTQAALETDRPLVVTMDHSGGGGGAGLRPTDTARREIET